jgi:hypothetical protein
MEQAADGTPQGERLSSSGGPPPWAPPAPPPSWQPPPPQTWGPPPGASAGPAAWGPPGPPGPPRGWVPPPPSGPPPGGWSPPPGPPPHEPRYSVAGIIVVVVLGLFVLFGLIGAVTDDDADAESPPAGGATETSTTAPPSTTEPPAPEPGFGDGIFLVGSDIQPGTYRADGTSDCYWKRLSDLSGDLDAILANDNAVGQVYVEMLPTDVAFSTEGCGRWLPATATGPDVSSGFGDGAYLVGSDIQPGTYRADGTSDCYWKRLSDLTGDLDAILANDNAVGQVYVEVLPTDAAFSTEGCGTWSRIG